jgi:hypothetical protein
MLMFVALWTVYYPASLKNISTQPLCGNDASIMGFYVTGNDKTTDENVSFCGSAYGYGAPMQGKINFKPSDVTGLKFEKQDDNN